MTSKDLVAFGTSKRERERVSGSSSIEDHVLFCPFTNSVLNGYVAALSSVASVALLAMRPSKITGHFLFGLWAAPRG